MPKTVRAGRQVVLHASLPSRSSDSVHSVARNIPVLEGPIDPTAERSSGSYVHQQWVPQKALRSVQYS